MINVKKGPMPVHLLNSISSPDNDRFKIIDLIETQNKTWKEIGSFTFKDYSDDSVKSQLKNDFNFKCAYCESIFMHNSYGEVEHWRPKKAVKDNAAHKGYYWLASDWDNLLWACRICNSAKYKGNHFPLKNLANTCYSSGDNLMNEEPLLLNPCNLTIPIKDHIKFLKNGLIQGKTKEGAVSIDIYGLKRHNLQAERYKQANELERYFNLIEIAFQDLILYIEFRRDCSLKNLKGIISNKIKSKQSQIDELIIAINNRLSVENEFVGMNIQLANYYVNSYSANATLHHILRNSINL